MTTGQSRLIETDAFPFDFLSQLAERESWRKEIYRPIYHLHKWWATRLGSIFRGMLLGSLLPADADLKLAFYEQHAFTAVTVFDPFMGSGTTIGEAHKLGCSALGRDINPVAAEGVRIVLGKLDPHLIHEEFRKLEATAGRRIRELYQTVDPAGTPCEVLYYFWVKQVACPACETPVDLFGSRIIGRNAFPDRKPEVRILCPDCGAIFTGTNGETAVSCPSCECRFDPSKGNAHGTKASCAACGNSFTILSSVRKTGGPPEHRLIGKLVLKATGEKEYLPATDIDREEYAKCGKRLTRELADGTIVLPSLRLQDGHNTRQAINYGYRLWRDFFNDRQLLALAWLHTAIDSIADTATREVLLTLFSSTLEFNNLFASYKGEGTGAVRHMFAHHILKPERMPIEANVWGTPKSSGAFSGLYRTRLLRAIEYRRKPGEIIQPGQGSGRRSPKGTVQCSEPFRGEVPTAWPPPSPLPARSISLSCGSSDKTDLSAKSVDIIVTDPPFFDNVHYSELADFFFAWQSLRPHGLLRGYRTTRCEKEVQDKRADQFTLKLGAVFSECHRILKDAGLLVFTYHHSRPDGWSALAAAVVNAEFSIVNAHPVKAEMSVATPKSQAKEPIQLDVILVCRKREGDRRTPIKGPAALTRAFDKAVAKAARLYGNGFRLSRNDRRVILYSQFLAELGPIAKAEETVLRLGDQQANLDAALDEPNFCQPINIDRSLTSDPQSQFTQRMLFE